MPLNETQRKEFERIIQGKREEDATINNNSTESSELALSKLLVEENFSSISKIEFSNPTAQGLNINGQSYVLQKDSKLNLLQYAVLYIKDVEIFKTLINILQAKFKGQEASLKQFYEQTLVCPLRNLQANSNAAQYEFSVYDLPEARLVQDFSSQEEAHKGSEAKAELKKCLKSLCPESFKALEEKREEGEEVETEATAEPCIKDLQEEVVNLKAQLLEQEKKIDELTGANTLLVKMSEERQAGWDNSKMASDDYKRESDAYLIRLQALEAQIEELNRGLEAAQAVEQNEGSRAEAGGEDQNITSSLAAVLLVQRVGAVENQAELEQVQAVMRVSAAEEEVRELKASNTQLGTENETLKTEQATSVARIAELEKQLKEAQADLPTRPNPFYTSLSNGDGISSHDQPQEDNKYAKSLEVRIKALKYTIVTIVLATIGGTVILSIVPKFMKNNEILDIFAKIGVGSIGVGMVALITYLLSPSEEKINTKMDKITLEASKPSPSIA